MLVRASDILNPFRPVLLSAMASLFRRRAADQIALFNDRLLQPS